MWEINVWSWGMILIGFIWYVTYATQESIIYESES